MSSPNADDAKGSPGPFDGKSDGELADRRGVLYAEKSELEERLKSVDKELIKRGVTSCEGTLFRAVVVPEGLQERVDREKLEAEKGKKFVAKYLKVAIRNAFVRSYARTGKLAEA